MRSRLYKILSSRIPALSWSLLIFILLTIPGKMLPDENQLTIPNLDKLVHIILFGCFVFLWSFYFARRKDLQNRLNKKLFRVFLIACFFGIAMEFVQKYFIPNRDFDIYDIAADIIGAAGGFIIVRLAVPRIIKTNL
jgi:VanZ family protein